MHISELQISNFKSFKSHAKLHNLSKNINIIVGKNGSGKSNITTAFSTILNPSKLMTDQKHALINESNVINQNKASIQIEILNNDRFPLKETVVLRRELDAKKDTYSIVENDLTNKIDDPVSLFENANITNNNYFVVQQGKINHFALMNDNERLELIKEIAGANVYEKDRKHCVQLMFETERSNEKTNEMLKTINEKLLMLQKEKKKLIELENLEKEKSKIEIAIYKKEKEQIDNELNKLNIVESFVTNESNDIDEIQEEIMYCKKQIEEMKDIGSASDINIEEVTKERDELEKQRNALESLYSELLKRQENNEQIMLGAKTNIEICKQKNMYYNKIVSSKEFMNYTQEHERHTKALEDLTKIAAQYKETSKVDAYKELQNKIMERNRLWTEEKKLKDKRQEVYNTYLRLERSSMFLGGGKYKEYSNIKNSPGVYGCVFELLTIPEELISAFESVAANSFFNVVVDNDEVATELCKKIDCRLTFIPLNRIKDNYEEIQLEDAFLLSSKISCKNIYKPILNYVTKNTYLTSDIKTGFLLSKTHNINIVTLDGDFISRKGFVSGGSDKKNSFLKDFKSKELEIKIYDKKMLDIKVKTNAITSEIEELQKNKNFENKPLSKHEYDLEVNVLRAKVSIVKSIIENGYNEKTINKAIEENKRQQKALEAKINNIENDTSSLSSELASLKLKKEVARNKHLEISNKYDSCMQYKKYVSLVNKITELKKLEQECNDKENQAIYQYSDNNNDARENKLKRDILIEKKLNLLRKIGRNTNNEYEDLSQSELYNQIKAINEKIKKLSNINKKALMMFEDYYDQKNKLQERLIQLQEERVKIDGFISDLDIKKTDTVNLTFKMIKDNFSYFYTKLSPKNNAELRLIDDGVSVKINDELITDLKKLSGGQKALLALSLIFSIQKIDPSPFYFFDEIDAHLDEQSRLNVSKLIYELSQMEPCTQFFIVSFRKEMISVGDKFYGVDFEDNNSIVKEIGKEEALNFVSDEIASNE